MILLIKRTSPAHSGAGLVNCIRHGETVCCDKVEIMGNLKNNFFAVTKHLPQGSISALSYIALKLVKVAKQRFHKFLYFMLGQKSGMVTGHNSKIGRVGEQQRKFKQVG